ncbi:MAG: GNAT family N-acetyltransferase [Candidatus Polarisedimenticolia bacterium]
MPGYRFCRTDDVPLLVRAENLCCAPHVPGEPPFTVESFKTGVRDLNLWASSCMVAMEGDDPLGVVLAAKREAEGQTLIYRIGVRPGSQRRGHGRHLLKSLSSKLSILGPPRLVAEIPADRNDLRGFFEASGYVPEVEFADYAREAPPAAAPSPDHLAVPVTLEELKEAGALRDDPSLSWERSPATLANRAPRLEGIGFASAERGFEAWVLSRPLPEGGGREVAALGCAGDGQAQALLGILVLHIASRSPRLVVPRVSESEVEGGQLEAWGFRKTRSYVRYAAQAAAA